MPIDSNIQYVQFNNWNDILAKLGVLAKNRRNNTTKKLIRIYEQFEYYFANGPIIGHNKSRPNPKFQETIRFFNWVMKQPDVKTEIETTVRSVNGELVFDIEPMVESIATFLSIDAKMYFEDIPDEHESFEMYTINQTRNTILGFLFTVVAERMDLVPTIESAIRSLRGKISNRTDVNEMFDDVLNMFSTIKAHPIRTDTLRTVGWNAPYVVTTEAADILEENSTSLLISDGADIGLLLRPNTNNHQDHTEAMKALLDTFSYLNEHRDLKVCWLKRKFI